MIVVSNTSPIVYLLMIGQINLLPHLFERIIIPEAVQNELQSPKAPPQVQQWIASPPQWLVVRPNPDLGDIDVAMLDFGEQAAILLAESLSADLILLDDLAARRVAASRGLALTGVLGILDRSASANWIDITEAIAQLQQTNFRISKAMIQTLLQQHCDSPDC